MIKTVYHSQLEVDFNQVSIISMNTSTMSLSVTLMSNTYPKGVECDG